MRLEVLIGEFCDVLHIDIFIYMLVFFIEERMTDTLDEERMPSGHFYYPCYFIFCKRSACLLCRCTDKFVSLFKGKRLKWIVIEDIEEGGICNTFVTYFIERSNRSCD